jgi:hypothetical protein
MVMMVCLFIKYFFIIVLVFVFISYLCRRNQLNGMDYDILESVSQGSDGAQDAENSRIAAIADELRRRSKLYEAQHGDGQPHVSPFEIELRITESFAKEHGLWIPMESRGRFS